MITDMIPFPYIVDAKLFDKVVQDVREYLDNNLSFAAWSFHIAREGITEDNEVYPQIYAQDGGTTHFDLRPDWDETAFFFFELNDPVTVNDEMELTVYKLSLVFYGRLDRIDPHNHDYTADIISEFMLHLKSHTIQAREITWETDPEAIWGKYTALKTDVDQNFMKFGTTFKINFTLLDYDCYEPLI